MYAVMEDRALNLAARLISGLIRAGRGKIKEISVNFKQFVFMAPPALCLKNMPMDTKIYLSGHRSSGCLCRHALLLHPERPKYIAGKYTILDI